MNPLGRIIRSETGLAVLPLLPLSLLNTPLSLKAVVLSAHACRLRLSPYAMSKTSNSIRSGGLVNIDESVSPRRRGAEAVEDFRERRKAVRAACCHSGASMTASRDAEHDTSAYFRQVLAVWHDSRPTV